MTPPSHARWNCSSLPSLQMKTSVLKVAGHLRRILQSSFWKLQVNLHLCTLEGTSISIISTFPQILSTDIPWVLHHHQSRKSYGWVPLASQHQDPHQPVMMEMDKNISGGKWWEMMVETYTNLHYFFPLKNQGAPQYRASLVGHLDFPILNGLKEQAKGRNCSMPPRNQSQAQDLANFCGASRLYG